MLATFVEAAIHLSNHALGKNVRLVFSIDIGRA